MIITLIVSTFNRPDALDLVLKSIENQTYLPDEVIIADDGSDNSTKSLISSYIKKSHLNIIHSWQEDEGFRLSESRNRAISLSSGEYLIIIDGDMILDKNFVFDHLNNAKEGQFIQGGRVLLTENKTRHILSEKRIKFSFYESGLKNKKNFIRSKFLSNIFSSKSRNIRSIRGCNMSFYRKDCIFVNGFNNNIKGWGREDSDFAQRLINSGLYKLQLKFSAVQMHLWHPNAETLLLNKNDDTLKKTISKKLIRCESGIKELVL